MAGIMLNDGCNFIQIGSGFIEYRRIDDKGEFFFGPLFWYG